MSLEISRPDGGIGSEINIRKPSGSAPWGMDFDIHTRAGVVTAKCNNPGEASLAQWKSLLTGDGQALKVDFGSIVSDSTAFTFASDNMMVSVDRILVKDQLEKAISLAERRLYEFRQ